MAAPSRRMPVTHLMLTKSVMILRLYRTLSLLPSSQKGQVYQEVQFYKMPRNDDIFTGDPRGYVIKLTGLGLKPNPYYLLQNTVTSSPVVVMRYPKFSETSFRWSQTV